MSYTGKKGMIGGCSRVEGTGPEQAMEAGASPSVGVDVSRE